MCLVPLRNEESKTLILLSFSTRSISSEIHFIDFQFDYAFDVMQYASREAQIKFHLSFAEHFAGLGDYKQAATHYVYGNSVRSAIDMLVKIFAYELR
jgi:hypothetical protein